jgi:hypothetical protein
VRELDEINWGVIEKAYKAIKNSEFVQRVDVVKGKIKVYAVPSGANPKNVIRIDIKP